jgi:cbb3-type cytochrome oxidase subunit 3
MKLVSNILEGMESIHIFYVIGLLLFFILFIIIFVRTMRRPAAEMNEIKESILIENDEDESKTS